MALSYTDPHEFWKSLNVHTIPRENGSSNTLESISNALKYLIIGLKYISFQYCVCMLLFTLTYNFGFVFLRLEFWHISIMGEFRSTIGKLRIWFQRCCSIGKGKTKRGGGIKNRKLYKRPKQANNPAVGFSFSPSYLLHGKPTMPQCFWC